MDKVPCIRAEHLSSDQIKAFRLADNKVAEFASWDVDMLLAELDEHYCDVILDRWEQETGQKAVKRE